MPALLACLLVAPALADDATDVLNLVKAARYPEALSRADAAIAARPRDAQLRFLKGVVLSEMNRPAEAIAIFTRLTEDHPQLPEPYNNLAVLYAGQGQYDKARATLEKALRTNPSYATAYDNLGDIHAKLAALAYDRALQADSGAGNSRTKLTLVRNLAPANSAPPRIADPAPLPRPQSLPQALPPSLPQALPPLAQAPQAAAPSRPAVNGQPATAQAGNGQAANGQAANAQSPNAQSANQQASGQTAKGQAPNGQAGSDPAAKAQAANGQSASTKPAATSPAAAPQARAEADNKARAAAKAGEVERDAVLATVHAWAREWSERDVKGYLAHYAPDFEPPNKQTRKAWADERQARIVGKGRILVKVESPQVSLDDGRATVKFRQQYTSDRLTVSSRKTLVLVRQKGKWLIQKESTGH